MAGLTIKAINNQYITQATINDFNDFLIECEAKLQQVAFKSEGYFKVFFQLSRTLNERELIQLFDCAHRNHTIILGINESVVNKPIKLWQTPLFAGQTYEFYEDTLIIGNIVKDTHVCVHGNLYVIGDIEGFVDMIHKDCVCYCSALNDGNLRIFDTTYQNMTIFTPTKLYYKNHQVVFCKLREGFYGN